MQKTADCYLETSKISNAINATDKIFMQSTLVQHMVSLGYKCKKEGKGTMPEAHLHRNAHNENLAVRKQ